MVLHNMQIVTQLTGGDVPRERKVIKGTGEKSNREEEGFTKGTD